MIAQDESERPDEMQFGARRDAQPCDVPRVGRDLRLKQRETKVVRREVFTI